MSQPASVETEVNIDVPGVMSLRMQPFTYFGGAGRIDVYEVHAPPPAPPLLTLNSRVFRIDAAGAQTTTTVDYAIHAVTPAVRPQVNELWQYLGEEWQYVRQGTYYNPSTEIQHGRSYVLGGLIAVFKRELQSERGAAVERGRNTFYRETFGNEAYYGGSVASGGLDLDAQLNAANLTARQLLDDYGFKLDVDVLAANGVTDVLPMLDDPVSARRLLVMGAFPGVRASSSPGDPQVLLQSFGMACGFCHGQVDDSVREGVGRLRPGMPNEELDVGKLLALSTAFSESERAMLRGWGRGLVDTRWNNTFEDNVVNPTAIPPLWDRMALSMSATSYFQGWDGLFSNLTDQALAFYDIVMHVDGEYAGTGLHPNAVVPAGMSFEDGNATNAINPDVIADLVAYERSLISPQPVPGVDFDPTAAERGWNIFIDSARGGGCVNCHQSPEFGTDLRVNFVPYPPAANALSSHDVPDLFFRDSMTSNGMRAPPLRGVRLTAPYMSDHASPTLEHVVEADAVFFGFTFEGTARADLVEYLKSL